MAHRAKHRIHPRCSHLWERSGLDRPQRTEGPSVSVWGLVCSPLPRTDTHIPLFLSSVCVSHSHTVSPISPSPCLWHGQHSPSFSLISVCLCLSVFRSLQLYVSLFPPGSLILFDSVLLYLCLPFCLSVPPSLCLCLCIYVSLSLRFEIAQTKRPRHRGPPVSPSVVPGPPPEGLAPTHSPTFVFSSSQPSLGLNSVCLPTQWLVLLCVCCTRAHICIHNSVHLSVCLCLGQPFSPSLSESLSQMLARDLPLRHGSGPPGPEERDSDMNNHGSMGPHAHGVLATRQALV